MSNNINIVVIGASYSGATVAQELVERLLVKKNSQENYHITVIEPKTAFESITSTANTLCEPDSAWTVNFNPNKLDLTQETGLQDIYLEVYNDMIDQMTTKKFGDTFLPYKDSAFVQHENVTLYHGVVTKINQNAVDVIIPSYLFSLLPQQIQDTLKADVQFPSLFQTFPSLPVGVYSLTESIPLLITTQHNTPTIIQQNGVAFISIIFPYHVLINCSGSTSQQPIKSHEHFVHPALYTAVKDVFPFFSELVTKLSNFFFNYDFEIIDQLPESWHLSVQSLAYLPKKIQTALVFHYFPHLAGDLLQSTSELAKNDFHTYRTVALLAFIFHLPTKTIVNNIRVEATSLSANIIDSIKTSDAAIPLHNSTFNRYIEFAAIRYMFIYSHYTRTNGDYYNTQLPIIHRVNFVGGGPTSVELLGNYMDIYYNHHTEAKKDIISMQKDIKKGKVNTSAIDVNPFNISKLHQPEFHLFTTSTIVSSLAPSAQIRARKHLKTAYKGVVREFVLHEESKWQFGTTQAIELEALLQKFDELNLNEEWTEIDHGPSEKNQLDVDEKSNDENATAEKAIDENGENNTTDFANDLENNQVNNLNETPIVTEENAPKDAVTELKLQETPIEQSEDGVEEVAKEIEQIEKIEAITSTIILSGPSPFYNRYSMVTVFAAGILRNHLVKGYESTPQLCTKQSITSLTAFVNKFAPIVDVVDLVKAEPLVVKSEATEEETIQNENLEKFQKQEQEQVDDLVLTQKQEEEQEQQEQVDDVVLIQKQEEEEHQEQVDDVVLIQKQEEEEEEEHQEQVDQVVLIQQEERPEQVDQVVLIQEQEEPINEIPECLPGFVFVVGDAATNPDTTATAYSAATNSPICAQNVVHYINTVLKPLLLALNPAPKVDAPEEVPTEVFPVTRHTIDAAIQGMTQISTSPDIMVVHFGQFDATMTGATTQYTRFVPFGAKICLGIRKSTRADALNRVRAKK